MRDLKELQVMATRKLRLLHVEDNPAHRRLIGYYLNGLPDLSLEITYADSEDAAVETFQKQGTDFVLLDYHLTQGNGLSCLKRLRQLDPVVPIVALSGAATPEIAAELLQVGADDYLSKQDLSRETLTQCLTNALARTQIYKRAADEATATKKIEPLEVSLLAICRTYVQKVPPDFLAALDAFEVAAKKASLSAGQLQHLFASTCTQLTKDATNVEILLRPILLEILLRLSGEEGVKAG
jgi:CheY-like chemotaxis protein